MERALSAERQLVEAVRKEAAATDEALQVGRRASRGAFFRFFLCVYLCSCILYMPCHGDT